MSGATQKEVLRTAVRAAGLAGALLLRHYGKLTSSQVHRKAKNDFVTDLDRRSEALILKTIRSSFPSHSVLAEESGAATRPCAAVTWIIDPLDGTANYIHHFPMFSVSIGVADAKGLWVGVVLDPLHQEWFTAVRGGGAYLNGKKIAVSSVAPLSEALMATGIPFRARDRFDGYMRSFRDISLASAGMRRGGSAALDLAYVACGRLDGFWELSLSPWDMAAGALLVREAGGRVTDLWGGPGFLESGDILASNGRLHRQLNAAASRVPKKKKGLR